MSQNLVPLFCGLGGNTLSIGGTVVNGIAVLYLVSTVSTGLMNYVKWMPTIMENPSSLLNNNNTEKFDIKKFFQRCLVVTASIGIGLTAKRVGNFLSSDSGISTVSCFVGITESISSKK